MIAVGGENLIDLIQLVKRRYSTIPSIARWNATIVHWLPRVKINDYLFNTISTDNLGVRLADSFWLTISLAAQSGAKFLGGGDSQNSIPSYEFYREATASVRFLSMGL